MLISVIDSYVGYIFMCLCVYNKIGFQGHISFTKKRNCVTFHFHCALKQIMWQQNDMM